MLNVYFYAWLQLKSIAKGLKNPIVPTLQKKIEIAKEMINCRYNISDTR